MGERRRRHVQGHGEPLRNPLGHSLGTKFPLSETSS